MSFWTNPFKATRAFFGGKKPPKLQTQANNPIADKFPPINFTSVFDEISKDKLDIIKRLDGKLNLRFSNQDGRIDLDTPVQSRNINTRLPAINRLSERASEVVALSQAMTRLSNSIEQIENTNPYLIEQNQELINSFRTASENALDRGFDHRQYAIDQKLAQYGLNNSSTAFGVQVALAREKANAYADLELKQAQLAQGLKQQSIANLHQRGDLLNRNAAVELERFNAESRNQLTNEEMVQNQALAERQLEAQNEERRLATDFANRNMLEQRRARMAELGLNAFNQGNNQSIGARNTDNNAIAQQNKDQLDRFSNTRPPFEHTLGRQLLGNGIGILGGKLFNGFNTNPWKNPDNNRNAISFGTSNWSPTSSRLVGTKNGGMRWS